MSKKIEKTKRPDESLPSEVFFIEQHIADAMPSPHWHDHIEVNYLLHGKMDYLLNGRRVTLQPKRLAVFWAAIHHQAIEVEPNQSLICAYIPIGDFLELEVEPKFRKALLQGMLVQSKTESSNNEIRLIEILQGWAEASSAMRQLYRDELLLRLRRMSLEPIDIAEHIPTQTPLSLEALPSSAITPKADAGERSVRHVERMTAYISQNLDAGLSVADVADAAGLHPTSASASFRRVLGITIGHYIRRQRLSQAMRLLAETEYEIAQIAHMAGYSSLPRLYDAFQQNVGKTPRRFRQDIKTRLKRRKSES